MIYGEASTTVTAPPAQVLDLVCDLERYKLANTKIRKVLGYCPGRASYTAKSSTQPACSRPLFDRFLGSWLTRDIEAEVSRLGQLLGTTTTDLTKAES